MMDDIDQSFDWYEAALKGERGPIDADNPRAGFYRAKSRDKSLHAVAIWYDTHTGELRYQHDGRDIDDMKARERWPHDSRRPISREVFESFMATGVWSDIDSAVQGQVAEEVAPNIKYANAISALKSSAAKYAKIESDEQMALAQSLRAELMEQGGAADKLRVAEKEPWLEASREVDAKWQPMIEVAKDTALTIRKALEAWNDHKLAQLAAAQKAAEAAAQEMDEPVVKSNAPMPSKQIRGGGGRAASVGVKDTVTAIDDDKVFQQFKGNVDLTDILMRLAQRAIDAGIPVPGATIEKRSKVR